MTKNHMIFSHPLGSLRTQSEIIHPQNAPEIVVRINTSINSVRPIDMKTPRGTPDVNPDRMPTILNAG
jgi:hypothetical protein